VATLERRGILDETVVVLTSDQGFFYGEFGLAQERRLAYDPSTHIPLVVRYPALASAGSQPGALVSNADLAPTLLALGGAAVPAGLDGQSFLPALRDSTAVVRDALLIEYSTDTEFPRLRGMGYKAVRTDRYKYIRYEALRGMDELYDLHADPHELHNLLPDGAAEGVRRALDERLNALLQGSGAPPTPAPRAP
jgi:arylsulfatase A-like enzyme